MPQGGPYRGLDDHLTRAGLNLIQQALSIYDADLRLVVYNRPFQMMFGLPEALVTPGARFEDTIRFLVTSGEYGDVSDVEQFVQDRVEQALAFEPHYMERQRANGRTISVEGSPLPEGGWVTVYTDITDIKQQEMLLRARSEELSDQLLAHAENLASSNRALAATIAQLEEAKRELTEMEARIRVTTEMTPAHIAHVDRDGIYTYTNHRLSSLLPERRNDIVGLSFEEALGPVAARLWPTLERALLGEASVLEFTEPTSGRRIRTAFTPDQADPRATINGVYLLSTDVTQETQARAALAQTHKRELAAQLTNGLAHDFANLLTIMLGLQTRLEKLDLPETAYDFTGATKAAARRCGDLLDKIAGMSGPPDRQERPVRPDAFLRTLLPLAQATLPDGIKLSTHSSVPDTAVWLDPGALQDTLLNLVLNARDAIGSEGEITITLARVSDTWLNISVRDTGPGFSKDVLDKALNPFFTTKGENGSGLGLTMAYDAAKLAGGTLTVGNAINGGAEVILRLPYKAADAPARPQLVLVVDDSAEIRAAVRDTLIDLDHQVVEAASVEEAASLAGIPGVDWVLSDINLGPQSGVDLLGQLADAHPQLKLALMTSLPAGDPERKRGAGRWPVLSKPLHDAELTRLLRSGAAA
ncbi:MAG: PAS-domain containing protein [Pseudomonadota bacterium]